MNSNSSNAGLVGLEFCSAYAASKFRLEGWMEWLQPEVAPFGIADTGNVGTPEWLGNAEPAPTSGIDWGPTETA